MSKTMRYSQNDPRFARKRLGNSSFFCGGHGCLVTSIGNALGLTPIEIIDVLEFTEDDHKYGGGLVIWNPKNLKALKKLGLIFMGRYRGFDRKEDIKILKDYCKDKRYVPLLEVRTRTKKQHWVRPINRAYTYRGFGWASDDPWTGEREWKTVGNGAPYINETGWLLFKRV